MNMTKVKHAPAHPDPAIRAWLARHNTPSATPWDLSSPAPGIVHGTRGTDPIGFVVDAVDERSLFVQHASARGEIEHMTIPLDTLVDALKRAGFEVRRAG